ncbi:hypothetical protein B0H13DRAFT_1867488 [Mycena leptocephala]|nr:hypothetical protein B0H13DRAFT_1867488 [Mycena leptocephala]
MSRVDKISLVPSKASVGEMVQRLCKLPSKYSTSPTPLVFQAVLFRVFALAFIRELVDMRKKCCKRSTADRIVGERNEREKAKEEIYCVVNSATSPEWRERRRRVNGRDEMRMWESGSPPARAPHKELPGIE